jgi:tetratricopeptide (TPR) repeat protein
MEFRMDEKRYPLARIVRLCQRLMLCLIVIICFLDISLSPGQENLPAMIRRIEPSVVVVLTSDREGHLLGQGSGFFISKNGDVITNYHVLQGVSRAAIRAWDGNMYSVKKVVAEERESDLIRISVDIGERIVPALLVSTSLPQVGERIVVIGTPLGLEKTVSDGIVAAIREIPEFGKVIQLTAPISQGSSGSPVVNMSGEVIGIATFFILAGQNLNFAISGENIARLTPGEGQTLSEREETRGEEMISLAGQLYSIGIRFLWIEDYEKALRYFLEAIKRNPDYGEAYFQIGYCNSKLGRYPEAIESYRQAIGIKQGDFGSYNNLCVAYNHLGRYSEAVVSCQKAIQLKPDFGEAYNNLAWSLNKLGRCQEAIEASKEAIRIKPDFAMAHYNLGNSLSVLGNYPEAIKSYKEAIRIQFDYAESHLNLGAAYFRMGRYQEAIESYKQAVRINFGLAEAHLNLGMAYLGLGDRGSALDEYKILKDQDKDLANRLFNLIYE